MLLNPLSLLAVILVSTTTTCSAFQPSFGIQQRLPNTLSTNLQYASTTSTPELVNGLPDPSQTSTAVPDADMPPYGEDGLYHIGIETAAEHAALLAKYPDQIIVLKCYAPWCRACKGLAPKFMQVRNDEKYSDMPIIWADLTIAHNKDFVKSLGVLALPTVQFYVAGQLQDSFPCGPSKVPIFKRKLAALVSTYVDADTKTIKEEFLTPSKAVGPVEATPSAVQEDVMDSDERDRYLKHVPYLKELSLADLDEVFDKAKLQTFEMGSVLMREGEPGRTFYMIRTGQVEVCQEILGAGDPLVSKDFLGTLINILEGPTDFFGERALMTGEPRAASIRASTKITCWTLDKTDFPASSVLSGRTHKPDKTVDDKYGVSLWQEVQDSQQRQVQEVSKATQQRGSVNTPERIRGLDYEDDEEEAATISQGEEATIVDNDAIFATLTRFHMIRRVRHCLEYMRKNNAVLDAGNRNRRNMLVKRLSPSRRTEFLETFQLLDTNEDGAIELVELSRVVATVRDDNSDEELLQAFQQTTGVQGNTQLTKEDFMGVMAEAEFFQLFHDIFASLDKYKTGFVKARDLDTVLCGVRDLISDDRKSLIDGKDMDMHIDYEQFSRLLLGTTLT